MDNILLDVFDTLRRSGLNYCLLRGYDELEQSGPSNEIDLLIAPDHLPQLAKLLAAKRFVRLPSWGYASHNFFVVYNRGTDTWLKLDVVTDLRYGRPMRVLRTYLEEPCLRNRRWRAPTYILSPEDEFITLVLHCLLDKGAFRAAHRERLTRLRQEIVDDRDASTRLAEHVERFLVPSINWRTLVQAIDAQEWSTLIRRRFGVAQHLFWQDAAAGLCHTFSEWLVRALRPLFYAVRRRGFMVAILAPDGAGKSTLALGLTRDPQLRARWLYTGTNVDADGIGLPTSRWFHRRLKSLDEAAHRMPVRWIALKALSFSNRLVEQWYRLGIGFYHKHRGRFVVFDRYLYDSWLGTPPLTPWQRLRRWLLGAGWPKPDIVILLDAPGTVLYQRKGEHTAQWLEHRRRAYLGLKERIPQMIVVDATREADEVRREVTSLIWNGYRARLDKNKSKAHMYE